MNHLYETNLYFTNKIIKIDDIKQIVDYFYNRGYLKIGTNEDELHQICDIKDQQLKELSNDFFIIKNRNEFVSIGYNLQNCNNLHSLTCNIKISYKETKIFFNELIDLLENIGCNIIYGNFDLELVIEKRHWQFTKNSKGITIQEPVGVSLHIDGIPAISYLNFFGKEYTDMIDKKKLLTCPVPEKYEFQSGVIVKSRDNINQRTIIDERLEQKIIDYLGEEYFWQLPDTKATKFPKIDWGLEEKKTVKNNFGAIDTSENKELQKKITENTELCIKQAKQNFGIDLDYSEESISKLEHIITKYFPYKREFSGELVSAFGSLLGEIIRKNIGGYWGYYNYQGEEIVALMDYQGKDSVLFPIDKIYKRLNDGKGDDIEFYYKVIKRGLD